VVVTLGSYNQLGETIERKCRVSVKSPGRVRVLVIIQKNGIRNHIPMKTPKLAVSNISVKKMNDSGPGVNKSQFTILSDIGSISL